MAYSGLEQFEGWPDEKVIKKLEEAFTLSEMLGSASPASLESFCSRIWLEAGLRNLKIQESQKGKIEE